jgi:regulator of sigma E protease
MDFFRNCLFFLIAIIVLVGFHEFGHFIVARICGVKVLRFSLGFGKVIFAHKGRDGCEYALSLIPLGGYVKMLDRREGEVSDDEVEHEFTSQNVWKRLAIVAAGPVFNIILAFFLYYAMFVIGVAAVKPYVTGITAESQAWQAGLRNDDLILRVDDKDVIDWEDALYELIQHVGDDSVRLTVRDRAGNVSEKRLDLADWSIHRDQGGNIFQPLGFSPKFYNITRRIGAVLKDSPAEKAGLKKGDEVESIDGRSVESWFDFSSYIAARPGQTVTVGVLRSDIPSGILDGNEEINYADYPSERKFFSVTLGRVGEPESPKGQIGVQVMVEPLEDGTRFIRKYGLGEAVFKSVDKMISVCKMTVVTIGKLVNGSIPVENISGPIAIAKSAGITASIGIEYFIGFMALISINLGIMNLIPLPVLDGGHIMFYTVEALTGRRLPDKVMLGLMYLGIFVLLLIMTLAVYNDIVFD